MKTALLIGLLGAVYGSNKFTNRGLPEIPNDFFNSPIHSMRNGNMKGPIPEKRLPNIRIPDMRVMTGQALLDRHKAALNDFIGTNILANNNKGQNNGYYKGDGDSSPSNKYKRWYRPPVYPGNKGGPTPTPPPSELTTTSTTNPPVITTTVAPPPATTLPDTTIAICDFEGLYEYIDDQNNVVQISVCENNGIYSVGVSEAGFTEYIGRGNDNIIINGDTQTLELDVLNLKQRMSSQDLCYETNLINMECDTSVDPNRISYNGIPLTRVANSADPSDCYQANNNFTQYTEPIGFVGTAIQHVTNIDTPGVSCFAGDINGAVTCDYDIIDDIFDDTVRIACCGDAPGIAGSFWTPISPTNAKGVTKYDSIPRETQYTIETNTIRFCPL